MANILFLDIDGVLNSNFWNDSHQREISDGTLIDEEKIKLLACLVKKTNAKIILHSGWRIWFDSELKPLRIEAKRLIELLEKEGLHIEGLTPDLTTEEIRRTKKFSLVKGEEILLWLSLHDDVTKWVVLDDLDLHNIQIEQHQVKPDQATGLTLADVEKAVKILLGGNQMIIRAYEKKDLKSMIKIWNEVVEEGIAFPQEELLDNITGADFFASQTYVAVAEDESNHAICGLYILHPNNIGRCGHICNTSYAVGSEYRGQHIGEQLVLDSLCQAKKHAFKILQFNAVVESNTHARHLYERLGFVQLGTIPNGFKMKDGHFENICPYYHAL